MIDRRTAFGVLWLTGCAAKVDVPPPPPPVLPPPVVTPVIDITPPPPPTWMAVDDYKPSYLKGVSAYFRGRRTIVVAKTSTGTPPHDIVTVQTIGRERTFIVFTSGLGRVGRSARGLPPEHQHVELVAYTPIVGPGVGRVLSTVGANLFQRAGGLWKSYDTVTLPKPVLGLRHFDLLPGGEVDVGDGLRVSLYKVVPLSQDEYEKAKAEGGSQWVDSTAADPAARDRDNERWRPALRE